MPPDTGSCWAVISGCACDGTTIDLPCGGTYASRPVLSESPCSACASGTTQCAGNSVTTCQADGGWGPPSACIHQTCVSGVCSGVCAPGEARCSGQQPQTCGPTGNWQTGTACVNQACVNGTCQGTCTPGSTQCASIDGGGEIVETCQSDGTWGTSTACGGCGMSCITGACIGVCTPGSTQCSGNAVQACDNGCAWGMPVPCVNAACVNGACQGVCTPGSTQCVGGVVESCASNGFWVSAPCDGGVCDAVLACPDDAAASDQGSSSRVGPRVGLA